MDEDDFGEVLYQFSWYDNQWVAEDIHEDAFETSDEEPGPDLETDVYEHEYNVQYDEIDTLDEGDGQTDYGNHNRYFNSKDYENFIDPVFAEKDTFFF